MLGELSRRDDDNENRRTGPGFYRKRRVSRAQSLYASARIENRREAVTTIRDGRGKQGNVLSDRSSIPPSCGLPTPTPTAARAVSEPTSVTFARFEHPSELVCRVSSARGPRLIGPSQMLRSLMNVVAPSQYPDGDTITGGFTGGPGDPVPSTFLRPPSQGHLPNPPLLPAPHPRSLRVPVPRSCTTLRVLPPAYHILPSIHRGDGWRLKIFSSLSSPSSRSSRIHLALFDLLFFCSQSLFV